MSDFTATPYILDTSVLADVARGDADLIGLLQDFDRARQPLIVPALAASGALLDGRGTPDAQALLAGLVAFEHAIVAPLDGIAQSAKVVDMMSITGLDIYDAHAAAIADVSVCPILTLDSDKWQQPSHALDNPLHVIEIADPDE
ncbi:hypothetical protein [Microbispora siamensis]|uniref:PIN domain-containing protein n=1 Tax=Microbispora siamensis TaxID=564413 RepID=A0ABQ4GN79_9ACTN|nr:hypothetical protein [Microbispora siamensis]GIH62888.1 hypothetical protein Msi02_37050 [Microbispora siamensis]